MCHWDRQPGLSASGTGGNVNVMSGSGSVSGSRGSVSGSRGSVSGSQGSVSGSSIKLFSSAALKLALEQVHQQQRQETCPCPQHPVKDSVEMQA